MGDAGAIPIVASMTSYRVTSGRFRAVLVRQRGTLAVGSLLGSGTRAANAGTARRGPCLEGHTWDVTRHLGVRILYPARLSEGYSASPHPVVQMQRELAM